MRIKDNFKITDIWGRPGITIHYDNLTTCIEILSDEQLGECFRKLIEYAINGNLYECDDFSNQAVYLAYMQMCGSTSHLGEKYKETCEKRRGSGKMGGEATATKRHQKTPNGANIDIDTEIDKETDKENEWFDVVWNAYPLKRGRSDISPEQIGALKELGVGVLLECISNYEKDRAENPDRHTLNGSTFFNGRYKDYLPENYEPERSVEAVKSEADVTELEDKLKSLTEHLDKINDEITAMYHRGENTSNREAYNELKDTRAQLMSQIASIEEALSKRK